MDGTHHALLGTSFEHQDDGLESSRDEPDWEGAITEVRGGASFLPSRKKRGGRKKGSRNKKTVERAKAISAIQASGKDPISFFADLLRNEEAPLDLRFQAARELAPFVHPKLASIESRTGGRTHEERLAELQGMLDESEDGA